MIIALPPSEGKSEPDIAAEAHVSFPQLDEARAQVAAALAAFGSSDAAAAALKVGPKSRADLAWNISPGRAGFAYEIYSGVLFDAAQLRSARPDRDVWIFSGKYGVVRPSDVIAPYRLPAGSKLPGLGILASYWKPRLSATLDEAARRDGLVVDCRSGPYQRMWQVAAGVAHVSVQAVRERDGVRSIVSHMAKHYRGLLTHELTTTRAKVASIADVARIAKRTGLGVEVESRSADVAMLTLVIRD